MQRTKFWLDTLNTTVEGWSDGSDWNGWAVPYFEEADARQLVELYNNLEWGPRDKAWYDTERDAFCFLLDGEDEPECYSSADLEINGRPTKLYPIGSGSWIWEEHSGD